MSEGHSSIPPPKTRRARPNASDRELLDLTNLRIIEELVLDARITIAELGRRVSLSAPAVAERVQRLERAGVITGYHANVDPKALGYALAVVVRVAPATRQLQRIPEIARDTPEVVECHRITGEDCFFLKLHLRSIDDLEEILDRFTPYGRTTTSIVHSSPVERRLPPLEPS
jgi:Lrp/AsnC family leucine-responsive transcriptional regulator